MAESDATGELKRELMSLILPTKSAGITPLVSAAYTEDPELFTAVLKAIDGYATQSEGGWLSGDTVRRRSTRYRGMNRVECQLQDPPVTLRRFTWSFLRVGVDLFSTEKVIPHQFTVFLISRQ